MASINKLMVPDGADEHYNAKFRVCIEDHLNYLRQDVNVETRTFDNGIAYKYENDFNGLLNYLGVAKELHWLVLRVNGFTSPMEYTGDVNFIYIPKLSVINTLRATWSATYM